jgi:hypothetical protein
MSAQPECFSKNNFQHEPFTDPGNELRLLRLLPGAANSQIQLELHHISFSPQDPFDENFSPPVKYHALSHQWGPPDVTHQIMLNGKTFEVRHNLHNLLLQLRSHFQDATSDFSPAQIWCDAICVYLDRS